MIGSTTQLSGFDSWLEDVFIKTVVSCVTGFALFFSNLNGLSPSTANAQTLQEFNEIVRKYSAGSPAGGPSKNPDAAVFVFLRESNKLCWVENGNVSLVEIKPTKEKNDTKQKGPTPLGEFLIGQRFTHGEHKIDWYKLYPRIEDKTGYYGYTAKTKTGRFAMGLHPGAVSHGCVTVKSNSDPYDEAEGWKLIRKKLDSATLTYKGDSFSGLLYVENR